MSRYIGVVFSSRHNDYFCLFVVSDKCKNKKTKKKTTNKQTKKKKCEKKCYAFATEKQNNEDNHFFVVWWKENMHRRRAQFSMSALNYRLHLYIKAYDDVFFSVFNVQNQDMGS